MDRQSPAVYAHALFQTMAESVSRQLTALREGLKADPALRQSLADPTVELRDKAQRVLALLPANTSPEVQQFVQFLLSEGALDELDGIVAELGQMARGGPRTVPAVVTSAVPLSEAEQAQLRDKLTRDVGGALDFRFEVDPELIGGLVVRVGDRIVDASVATRLRQLRESILRAL